MKPGLSLARIGVRPMRRPTSVVASSACRGGVGGGDDLDQLHQRRRVEEVHADDALGARHPAAIAVIGSEEVLLARIVCGPQASARAAKSSRFRARSSGAASTTRSHSARSARLWAPPARLLAVSASASLQSLRRALVQAVVELLQARLQGGGDRVIEPGLVAAERGDLGDPGAHRAGADDADPFDRRPHRPSNFGSRFSRKAVMPSTRSSVAIASS